MAPDAWSLIPAAFAVGAFYAGFRRQQRDLNRAMRSMREQFAAAERRRRAALTVLLECCKEADRERVRRLLE